MNTEQERAAFEEWAANIGFSVTGKYAETIDVLCAESAFKAGYRAGRAAERQRQADEQARIEAEARAREADKAHKARVMGEAKEALMAMNITEELAKAIILKIARREIPNVTINF